ncbi:MAG: sensor histidine kinase [Coprobacillaceae bacterium]
MFLDFNKMVAELGSIETLKTDFISNVSHEIKTPISIMQNYAEMLKVEKLSDSKRIMYAETIEIANKRLASLISNILKLNKLENQKISLEVQSYNVCEQLCNCAISFQELWEEKNLEFEAEIEDIGIIYADESLMEIVWNNLLSNAIKFSKEGGKVRISETSTEDTITISISDTGCGIDDTTIKHIFDKFYQGDTSHTKQGNGLGLTLVSRIIELSNATITVESKINEGTTFTVNIPVNYDKDEQENE